MEFTIGYVCGAVMMVVAYVIICIAVKNNNKIKDKETNKSDKANNNEAKGTFTLPDITKMTLEDVVNRKGYLETVVDCMRLLDIGADRLSSFGIDVYTSNSGSYFGDGRLHIFTEDATFKKHFLDAINKFVQDYTQNNEPTQDNQPTNKSDDKL